jgi:hypothetical protein
MKQIFFLLILTIFERVSGSTLEKIIFYDPLTRYESIFLCNMRLFGSVIDTTDQENVDYILKSFNKTILSNFKFHRDIYRDDSLKNFVLWRHLSGFPMISSNSIHLKSGKSFFLKLLFNL